MVRSIGMGNYMTREIKFRAWDKDRMVKGFELFEDNSAYRGAIPMQFTGLLDKNGKEIYEGDIVNSSGDRNMQVSIGGYWETVGGNGHGVHIHNQKETRVFGVSPFNQDNALEIIGNIYENPELIK